VTIPSQYGRHIYKTPSGFECKIRRTYIGRYDTPELARAARDKHLATLTAPAAEARAEEKEQQKEEKRDRSMKIVVRTQRRGS
jgi:hypothetical protein